MGKQRVRLGSSSNSINGSVVAPAGRGGAGRSGGGRRLSVAVRAAKSSKSSKASQAAKAEAELAAAEEQLASEMAEAADADAVDGATAADANATASAAPAAPAAPAAAPPPLPRPPSQGTSKQYRSSGSSSPVQPAADFDITLVGAAAIAIGGVAYFILQKKQGGGSTAEMEGPGRYCLCSPRLPRSF